MPELAVPAAVAPKNGPEPAATHARLAAEYQAPDMRGPFNLATRRAAGFGELELAALPARGQGVSQ